MNSVAGSVQQSFSTACRRLFSKSLGWGATELTAVLLTFVCSICGQDCVCHATDEKHTADGVFDFEILVDSKPSTVSGRIHMEAQDGGVLLHERNGRIRTLTPDKILNRTPSNLVFPLPPDELGSDLLLHVPGGFEIYQTDHYVIGSNSSEEYAEFCGKLLERVYAQYFRFMMEQEIEVQEPAGKLPILIFASDAEFIAYAQKQHPETSFKDTPGYYSVRDNQTLLMDLTRDRSMRQAAAIGRKLSEQPLQVATMVHEAVHQLAFNSGLQVRMADNPVWVSEGLSLYFEQVVPKSSLLWTKPGMVNARHHPVFLNAVASGTPQISFQELTATDRSFTNSETVAIAYAESWALTSYLFRREKEGMKKFLTNLASRKPLKQVSSEERVVEFRTAFGKSPDEMQSEVISYVKRLRVSK